MSVANLLLQGVTTAYGFSIGWLGQRDDRRRVVAWVGRRGGVPSRIQRKRVNEIGIAIAISVGDEWIGSLCEFDDVRYAVAVDVRIRAIDAGEHVNGVG